MKSYANVLGRVLDVSGRVAVYFRCVAVYFTTWFSILKRVCGVCGEIMGIMDLLFGWCGLF